MISIGGPAGAAGAPAPGFPKPPDGAPPPNPPDGALPPNPPDGAPPPNAEGAPPPNPPDGGPYAVDGRDGAAVVNRIITLLTIEGKV